MIRRYLLLTFLVLPLTAAACGGDDDSSGESPEVTGGGDVTAYCDAMQGYADASSTVDTSSVEAIIADFEELATLQRELAETAPGEVRKAHVALADASDGLVAGLREQDPKTIEEFGAAQETVVADLQEEYGDLVSETADVEEFADEECGIQLRE